MRYLVLVLALALPAAAGAQSAQVQPGSQPALEVQRLAPQLVAFAGGDVNFNNLVNGLALGLPVTLTTATAPGVNQVVNFTPAGTMSVTQIAQLLESARQSLIARGIATPTAEQLGAVLAGGTLTTPLGATPTTGLVSTSTGLATNTASSTSAAAALQNANSAAVAGATARRNMGDSVFPRGISDTPATPVAGATGANTTTPAAASVRGGPSATSATAASAATTTAPAGTTTSPSAPVRTR